MTCAVVIGIDHNLGDLALSGACTASARGNRSTSGEHPIHGSFVTQSHCGVGRGNRAGLRTVGGGAPCRACRRRIGRIAACIVAVIVIPVIVVGGPIVFFFFGSAIFVGIDEDETHHNRLFQLAQRRSFF